MKPAELIPLIEGALRGLRSCDTQASAVAWMTQAYKLLEATLPYLKDAEKPQLPPIIIIPERPKLEIVQRIPRDFQLHPAPVETVVYPQTFLHPGLKPIPKAWTHADTVKLERQIALKYGNLHKKAK